MKKRQSASDVDEQHQRLVEAIANGDAAEAYSKVLAQVLDSVGQKN